MIRLFKHYIPKPVFALGFVEIVILAVAITMGLTVRFTQLDLLPIQYGHHLPVFATFVIIVYVSMLAVGLYQTESCRDIRIMVVRLPIAMLLSFIMMSVASFVLPDVSIWRSIFAYSIGFAIVGIVISRIVFTHVADLDLFRQRVIVLGAGARAERIRNMEKFSSNRGFYCVAAVRMTDNETQIAGARDFDDVRPLVKFAEAHEANEIVVASEERRGTLPVAELLACKMEGFKITDATTFIEQQTGAVDLESMSPSWLIFSDGFVGSSQVDLVLKRGFDILASLILLCISLPILIGTAVVIRLTSPGPIFYRQERVGQGGKPFMVMKFRSMRTDAEKNGPQWAQKNDARVTPVGQFIRASRIDEIPQIFNVLKGDMSFVGPRPERPVFVEELALEIPYFHERHRVKPGITGWAQINYPYGASVEDARHKLQYDLYYIKNYTIFLDFLVLIQTLRVVIWPDGVR
ncbi:TIGR03013 family XrtA/PEP-CTERM system glycosyltransferase [Govanella unica]|uniref:TIGR03013 family PEP-CTERM/XrtA system glycosyltransferase n=1 Tax=Govanella unica TaxID=2975056 RepID=A0A9X3Z6X8_9PROT|nr:TIGR03013 family XrtA/PEP-CTERM system glycosyltransferase [Govania unica]MDA5193577.1 TIGR03013 family PEP-CTERM/XrtA system glycosyltransferase [Govania unica]